LLSGRLRGRILSCVRFTSKGGAGWCGDSLALVEFRLVAARASELLVLHWRGDSGEGSWRMICCSEDVREERSNARMHGVREAENLGRA
jgi:hypothetical protein